MNHLPALDGGAEFVPRNQPNMDDQLGGCPGGPWLWLTPSAPPFSAGTLKNDPRTGPGRDAGIPPIGFALPVPILVPGLSYGSSIPRKGETWGLWQNWI